MGSEFLNELNSLNSTETNSFKSKNFTKFYFENGKWNTIIDYYAFFCVENRMRTPLGKPLQTFTKFEG